MRDKLAALQWLTSRLERLRHARAEMSFIYQVSGGDGVTVWYLIHAARVVCAIRPPRNAIDKANARQALRAVYQTHSPALLDSHEHVDGMMLVMAWFRKYPKELKKAINVEEAMARCG